MGAAGDVADDLTLAAGEGLERGIAQVGSDVGLERGRHPHVPFGHRLDGAHQGFDREALEDDAAGAGTQGGDGVLGALAGGDHQHGGALRESLDVRERRAVHLQVEEQDVVRRDRELGEELVGAGELRHHRHVRLELEDGDQALAEERVVVGDRDSHHGSGLGSKAQRPARLRAPAVVPIRSADQAS